MAAANLKLTALRQQSLVKEAQKRGLTALDFAVELTNAAFPGSADWDAAQWQNAFSKECTLEQQEAYTFWCYASLPIYQQAKKVQTRQGEAMSVLTFGRDELPGSDRIAAGL